MSACPDGNSTRMTTPTSHNNLPAQQAGLGRPAWALGVGHLGGERAAEPRPHPRKTPPARQMADRDRTPWSDSSSARLPRPLPAAAGTAP